MATEKSYEGSNEIAVEITVNEQRVRVSGERMTGKDIKQAAVDHKVIADLEFVLQH